MISAGFSAAESAGDSDIIIINTCGFIREAKEEAIEVILDAVALKEDDVKADRLYISHGKRTYKNFPRKVAVTGCLAKRYFKEISEEMPEIDFIYGIPDSSFITDMCVTFGVSSEPFSLLRRRLYNNYPYSYLKISDGCSNNCSYCAIPIIRGPLSNFAPDEIVSDAKDCVAKGALELNIIAQDITSYKYGNVMLPELIGMVSDIEALKWIRLLYCHPDRITDDIIGIFRSNKKVVPYIDIPFQHVSSRILESMGRKGNTVIYGRLVEKLRREVPGIRIRSTFMIGYPGETDSEFDELMQFLHGFRLDRVGCFIYSPEEGTRAVRLEDSVPAELKQERYDSIMTLQKSVSQEKLRKMTGVELDVLVEEEVDKNTYIARTIYDAPEVDGVFYLTADVNPVNNIVRARVTDSIEYDLIGEII